jgi:hypothetical protein
MLPNSISAYLPTLSTGVLVPLNLGRCVPSHDATSIASRRLRQAPDGFCRMKLDLIVNLAFGKWS